MTGNEFYSIATDEEMKEVREKGERIRAVDDKIEVYGYLYKGKIYIDDVILVKDKVDDRN